MEDLKYQQIEGSIHSFVNKYSPWTKNPIVKNTQEKIGSLHQNIFFSIDNVKIEPLSLILYSLRLKKVYLQPFQV